MNNDLLRTICACADSHLQTATDVSNAVFSFAELSLKEFKSAEYYCTLLEKEGFAVERGVCGIKTAFTASYGNGSPRIAILAEYDALSGLSQVAASTEKKPLTPGGSGHGCGHNLLGAGALTAALTVRDYLSSGKKGTVVLCGCPGEEGGAAKAFMAKKKFWSSFGAALTWHPDDINTVAVGTNNSCIQAMYKFTGVASHAAGDPESGRSALDAMELMNIGVQYLREHMPQTARVHYAITDGGGLSPNVVQPTASVLYMIRSPRVKAALELTERVDAIAEGAALMTGTSVKKVFIDGCSGCLPNSTLSKEMFNMMLQIGAPVFTAEESEYAAKLAATYGGPGDVSCRFKSKNCFEAARSGSITPAGKKKAMLDFIIPPDDESAFSPGSTDVGDVSWQTPTAQIYTACFPAGQPGHSWQNVSCTGSSVGLKGMLYAAKVIAATAVELFDSPKTLETAKNEFEWASCSGYICPIPDGAEPITPEEA